MMDQLLQKQAESLRRLRPDQWKSGSIGWLIDAAVDVESVRAALQWLAAGPFKERPLKMTVRGVAGGTTVPTDGDGFREGLNPSYDLLLSVVPAKAGTHNHCRLLLKEAISHRAKTRSRGVWVPAFAGTTSYESLPDRQITRLPVQSF